MTSASELFYSRRYRFGREDHSELGFGSSYSSPDRIIHHQQHHHHNHGHRRHRRQQQHQHQQRRDFDDCNPVRRYPHARPFCPREHEPVRLDYVTSQSRTEQSSSSSENIQNTSNRMRYAHNDRLPGSVLLARERLVERLRGVSLSGSRQNPGVFSGISSDELSNNDGTRQVDPRDRETETPIHWLAEGISLAELANRNYSSTMTNLVPPSSQDATKQKAPGLSLVEMKCLQKEVFSNEVKSQLSLAMLECSICLEKFAEGDELIYLPCRHQFHTECLDPWVQVCGDCPYCRNHIVLGQHKYNN